MGTRAPIVDAVVTKLVHVPPFTVSVAEFVEQEVQKNFLDRAMMEERFVKRTEAAGKKNIKVEDGVSTSRIDPARVSGHQTKLSDDNIAI